MQQHKIPSVSSSLSDSWVLEGLCCSSRVASTRAEATALLFLLMKTNYQYFKQQGFIRTQLQVRLCVCVWLCVCVCVVCVRTPIIVLLLCSIWLWLFLLADYSSSVKNVKSCHCQSHPAMSPSQYLYQHMLTMMTYMCSRYAKLIPLFSYFYPYTPH